MITINLAGLKDLVPYMLDTTLAIHLTDDPSVIRIDNRATNTFSIGEYTDPRHQGYVLDIRFSGRVNELPLYFLKLPISPRNGFNFAAGVKMRRVIYTEENLARLRADLTQAAYKRLLKHLEN